MPAFCFLPWKSSQVQTILYTALLVAADILSVLNFILLKRPGEKSLGNSKNNPDGNNGRQNWFVGTEYISAAHTALSRGDCRGKVVGESSILIEYSG